MGSIAGKTVGRTAAIVETTAATVADRRWLSVAVARAVRVRANF